MAQPPPAYDDSTDDDEEEARRSQKRREIPGFYFDEDAGAYFAIPKDGCTVSTAALAKQKSRQRQKDKVINTRPRAVTKHRS